MPTRQSATIRSSLNLAGTLIRKECIGEKNKTRSLWSSRQSHLVIIDQYDWPYTLHPRLLLCWLFLYPSSIRPCNVAAHIQPKLQLHVYDGSLGWQWHTTSSSVPAKWEKQFSPVVRSRTTATPVEWRQRTVFTNAFFTINSSMMLFTTPTEDQQKRNVTEPRCARCLSTLSCRPDAIPVYRCTRTCM